jgi:hypothetical protein
VRTSYTTQYDSILHKWLNSAAAAAAAAAVLTLARTTAVTDLTVSLSMPLFPYAHAEHALCDSHNSTETAVRM